MQQTEVKPYVLITIIILAIVMAFGVFLTVMYLQRRPDDNSYIVNVEGQDIVLNPVPEEKVVIVTQEGLGGEVIVVEPLPEQPVQVVSTNTPEPPPPPTVPPIPPTAVPSADMYVTTLHTVVGTDTLYSLSQQYNTSIALMARFGVSASDMIVGNIIPITIANPAYCPGYRPYVVIEGDTPLGLSLSAGITLEEFIQIGKLGPNNGVYETQVVCLP